MIDGTDLWRARLVMDHLGGQQRIVSILEPFGAVRFVSAEYFQDSGAVREAVIVVQQHGVVIEQDYQDWSKVHIQETPCFRP